MLAVANPARTLVALPPSMRPMLTVVPLAGSAMAAAKTTNSASAWIALAPCSGASPACDSTPTAVTLTIPVPLRAVLTAPSAVGSSTRVASTSAATCSMTGREDGEPISSSPLKTNVTVGTSPLSLASFNAQIPCTRPVFMSKMPGPPSFGRPFAAAGTHSASVPVGHTVS